MHDLNGQAGFQKRLMFLGIIASVLIYAICSYVALYKPFNLDEGDFASVAHNIRLCGKPVLYVAEDFIQDLCGLRLYSVEKHLGYGLWHPPLYVNLLGAWFKLLGETTVSGRLFGFSCALLSLLLLLKIIKEICAHESIGREDRFFISGLACILFFINPLVIQFSLLLDIDNSILTLLLLLFFYVFIRTQNQRLLARCTLLGLVFGISILAKLTTPVFALAGIFVFYILKGEIKRAFFEVFFIGATGAIFFVTVWVSYALLLGLPVDFFLVYNYGTKVLPAARYKVFFSLPLAGRTLLFLIFWVSPAFLILAISAVINEIRGFLQTKRPSPLLLLIVFSLVLFIFYTFVYPGIGMMKYQYMNIPLVIAITSFYIPKIIKGLTQRELLVSFFAGAVFFIFDYFCLTDSVFFALYFPEDASSIPAVLFYLLPVSALSIGLPLYFSGSLRNKRYLVLGCLVSLFVYNLSLDFKQMGPHTTTHDWNYYGEVGLQDTINYLHENLPEDGVLICRKDVGYYLKELKGRPDRRWYSNDNCFNLPPRKKEEFFLELMANDDIQFIELDAQAIRNHRLPNALFDYFYPDMRFGDFLVLKRKR